MDSIQYEDLAPYLIIKQENVIITYQDDQLVAPTSTDPLYPGNPPELEYTLQPVEEASENATAYTEHIIYNCEECDKNFESTTDLEAHLQTHSSSVYVCTECDKTFYSPDDFMHHKNLHLRPFECEICNKGFTTKGYLKVHQRVHTGEKPYECSTCHRCFSQKSSMDRHEKSHVNASERAKPPDSLSSASNSQEIVAVSSVGPKRFECNICSRKFYNYPTFKSHKRAHFIEQYKCTYCPKIFNTKRNFQIHRSLHTGKRPFKCNICNKSFSHPTIVERHHKVIHQITNIRYLQCRYCPKRFALKGLLKLHEKVHKRKPIRTHSIEVLESPEDVDALEVGEVLQGYECEICHKRFSQDNYLKLHQRVHITDRPHKCSICSKSFHRFDLLQRHEHGHNTPPLFECHVCNKSFKTRGYLRTHSRIHSGEKPFQCGVCWKCFNQRGSLNRHIKLCHPTIMDPNSVIIKLEEGMITTEHVEVPNQVRVEIYQCSTCDQQFNSGDALIVHQHEHAIEIQQPQVIGKKIECNICARNFTQRTSLKRHMRTVHGVFFSNQAAGLSSRNDTPRDPNAKKHECQICLRDFTQRTSLTRHMKTVHADLQKVKEEPQSIQESPQILPTLQVDESPATPVSSSNDSARTLRCDICNKSYSNKAYLKVHERIHSGEKPFQCTICNRSFNQSGSLNRHMKFCHPPNENTPKNNEGIVILKIELIDKNTALGLPSEHENQNGTESIYYTEKESMEPMEISSDQIVIKAENTDELYYAGTKELDMAENMVVKEEATQVYYTANPEDITQLQQNGFIVKNENADVFYADNSIQNIQMHVADENGTLVVKDEAQVYLTELGPTEVVLTEVPHEISNQIHLPESEHFIDQPTEVIISDLNSPPTLEEQIVTEQFPENSKDIECPVCYKRFSTRAYLTVHKRIHTGEKPYECKTCDKRFNHSGSLYRHKKIHATSS